MVIKELVPEMNRWREGNECLNLKDINQPPCSYKGSCREWIEELTTFIYLYPKEWDKIYTEYIEIVKKQVTKNISELAFFRDEEGYLRKVGEKDIFLCVRLEGNKMEVDFLKTAIEWTKVFNFNNYMEYCNLDYQKRKGYVNNLKGKIEEEIKNFLQMQINNIVIRISFEEDVNGSTFTGNDIYIDALNNSYFIL
ncbi:hypothetical protein [Sellimonas intestinalis]|uniref:hypothetical protein n=1 Tax=Sellimonas intestinalis TaxID=1653434 RepID=UPI003AB38BD0